MDSSCWFCILLGRVRGICRVSFLREPEPSGEMGLVAGVFMTMVFRTAWAKPPAKGKSSC